MKTLMTVAALSIMAAVTAPAFAQTKQNPPTQAECEKLQGMRWDDSSKTCVKKPG